MTATAKPGHLLGRPVKKREPDPIPDSLENVLRSVATAPLRREDEWDYLKRSVQVSRKHGP